MTKPQKEELRAYRIKLAGEGKKPKNPNRKKQFDRNNSNDRTSPSFNPKPKRAVSQAVAKEIKENEKETVTNAAGDAQVRQYILSLVNAVPPVGVNLRNANASSVSAVASLPHIPPDLHKILARASLN